MDPKAEQRMVRALERLAAAAELYAVDAGNAAADEAGGGVRKQAVLF